MQEYRWDQLHQRWVILSAKRAWRPGAHAAVKSLPEGRGACPFCPGHETETPPPLYVDRGSEMGSASWRVRVVPNRYEAVAATLPREELGAGPFASHPGYGLHEVVIETPRHDETAAAMPIEHWASVLRAYQVRLHAAQGSRGIASAIIFKNDGVEAGSSLAHPHSQLVALPFVPGALLTEAASLSGDGCFLCLAASREANGPREVLRAGGFWVWSPWGAGLPFSLLVAPEGHERQFETLEPERLLNLAGVFQRVWQVYDRALGEVAMNMVVHTAPFQPGADFHWHFEFLPRLTRLAGFELGAETCINPVSPEEAAARLRQLL